MSKEQLMTQIRESLELEDQDGYSGQILDTVKAIIDLPGEEMTDFECLAWIHKLVNHWSEVVDL